MFPVVSMIELETLKLHEFPLKLIKGDIFLIQSLFIFFQMI